MEDLHEAFPEEDILPVSEDAPIIPIDPERAPEIVSPEPQEPPYNEDLKGVKTAYSRIGLGAAAFIFGGTLIQLLLILACRQFLPEMDLGWVNLLATVAMHAVGGSLLLLCLPKEKLPNLITEGLKPRQWVDVIAISWAAIYLANLLGVVISQYLMSFLPIHVTNPVEELVSNIDFLPLALTTVVLAPVCEELICRKLIIDRARLYGEKRAILISAVVFSLFHGNLSQIPYALAVGLVLGYVYVRTGKIHYTMILHCLVNAQGSLLGPMVLNLGSEAFAAIYIVLVIAFAIYGVVRLVKNLRQIRFARMPLEPAPETPVRVCLWNAGMIIFYLLVLSEVIMNTL